MVKINITFLIVQQIVKRQRIEYKIHTLVNLIPRLYDVTEGEITVDGRDIRDITMKSLREKIGYVPQKGILFSGTIESNIRFGNKNATDEEV